jgi:hypothetical protein
MFSVLLQNKLACEGLPIPPPTVASLRTLRPFNFLQFPSKRANAHELTRGGTPFAGGGNREQSCGRYQCMASSVLTCRAGLE